MTHSAKSCGKASSPPLNHVGGSKSSDKAAGSKPNTTLALVPANQSKGDPTINGTDEIVMAASSGGAGMGDKSKCPSFKYCSLLLTNGGLFVTQLF